MDITSARNPSKHHENEYNNSNSIRDSRGFLLQSHLKAGRKSPSAFSSVFSHYYRRISSPHHCSLVFPRRGMVIVFLVVFLLIYVHSIMGPQVFHWRSPSPWDDASAIVLPIPKQDVSFGEWNPKSLYYEPYDDPPEELLYADFSKDDVRHSPVVDSVSMVLRHGIRMSGFDSTLVYISREERNFLIRHTLHLLSSPHPTNDKEDGNQEREEALASLARWSVVEPVNPQLSPVSTTVVWEPEALLPALIHGNSFFPSSISFAPRHEGNAVASPLPRPHPHPFNLFLDDYIIRDRVAESFTDTFCDAFAELMELPDSITHGKPLIVHHRKVRLARFVIQCLFFRHHELQRTAKRKFVLLTIDGYESSSYSFFAHHNFVRPFPTSFVNKSEKLIKKMDPTSNSPSLSSLALEASAVNATYLVNHPLLAHWYSTNHDVNAPGKTTAVPLGMWNSYPTPIFTNALLPRTLWLRHETDLATYISALFGDLNLKKMFQIPLNSSAQLRFGRKGVVYYETALEMFAGGTTDPPVEWIPLEQLPERVTTVYVVLMPLEYEKREGRPSLTSEVLVFRSESGNRATAAAQHVALLPFTAALYHKLQQHPYGDPSRDLKVTTGFTVWDWRVSFRKHLDAHPELAVEVNYTVGRMAYLTTMLRVAFVASPIGYGYDCLRTWESLMHGAVPILQHPDQYAHRICEEMGEISRRDFLHLPLPARLIRLNKKCRLHLQDMLKVYEELPVVVVNDPSEITLENLEKWRAEIYEKAKRGEYQLEKLFTQYWIDKIYGHTND